MLRAALLLLWLITSLPACVPLESMMPPLGGVQAEEDLYQRAEAAYRSHAYQQARQHYSAYLERFPSGRYASQVRLREAEVLGFLGDWSGSLRRYQSFLARNPAPDLALKARYGIGQAYFKLGEYQQANQVLDSLTAGDLPRSLWFSTQTLLGEIALRQGQVSQAFSRLRLAAQDLSSGDQEWFEDLKTRLVEQAAPADLENLATLYRDDPLSAALLLRLARLAQEGGRPEEAQKWISALQERFPTSPEAAAAVRVPAGARRTLGVLLPLSGELGNVGLKLRRGMELAVRGTPVGLTFKDTQGNPGAAAQAVRELAKDQSLLAILGPLSSGVAQTAAETAQQVRAPIVTLSQKPGITQIGDFIFQAFIAPRQQVRALIRHTLGNLGIRRYAVLYPDSAYGRTFLQSFQEELAAQGGQLTAEESYAPGTTNFAPFLTSLREAAQGQSQEPGPEALFIPDDSVTVAAIAGQLADSPWRAAQLLGSNLIHHAETQESQLKNLEGILFPDGFFAGDPAPPVQQFISAYHQQYGENPDYLAAQGYMMARLLVKLLESDKGLTRQGLPPRLAALRGTPDLPWFKGFSAEREQEAAFYVLTIKDGRVQMAPAAR